MKSTRRALAVLLSFLTAAAAVPRQAAAQLIVGGAAAGGALSASSVGAVPRIELSGPTLGVLSPAVGLAPALSAPAIPSVAVPVPPVSTVQPTQPVAEAEQLSQTLRGGVERILALQGKEGIWAAQYLGGPWHTALANIVSVLAATPGEVAEENKRLLLGLIDTQRPDGSFADYAGGPASKANTRIVSLALRVALEKNPALRADSVGRGRLARANAKALDFVNSGARPSENVPSALIADLLEDTIYPEESSRRRSTPILASLFRWMSGAHIVALQTHALLHSPVLRPLREALSVPLLMTLPALAVLSDAAGRDRWSTRLADKALGWLGLGDLPKKALRAIQGDIVKTQDPNGGWLYAGAVTALNVLALKKLGVSDADPAIQRGLAFLQARRRSAASGEMAQSFCDGSLWDSAVAGSVLLYNGIRADDPRIAKTIDSILAEQQPDGRWNFAVGSRRGTENDTTNVSMGFLVKAYPTSVPEQRAKIVSALERSVSALLKAQQRDGGWNSWSGTPWRFDSRAPGMLEASALDASTADVTGRVMVALASVRRSGVLGDDAGERIRRANRRAVKYLRNAQSRTGWWSRWITGYVTTGAWVVPALRVSGVRADNPMIQKERAFLRSHQNRDGGFGESVAADRDKRRARKGPSTPVQTALALTALIASSMTDEIGQDAAIAAAVRHLLASKQAEGWQDGNVFTATPTMEYYASPLNTQLAVIGALKLYQDARDSGVSAALRRLLGPAPTERS